MDIGWITQSVEPLSQYASDTPVFRAAMMRETSNLRKGGRLGGSAGATRAINRGLDTAARLFRQEPALLRREMLEKLAQKADLDLGEVRTFLTNEGPLGV